MRLNCLFFCLIFAIPGVLAGCDEVTSEETCAPNETSACSCEDGDNEISGTKICSDAGTAFSSCICEENEEEESEESDGLNEDNFEKETSIDSGNEGEEEGGETTEEEGGETNEEGGEPTEEEGGETIEEKGGEATEEEGGEATEEGGEGTEEEGGEATEEGGEAAEEEGGEATEEEGGEATEEEGGETTEEGGETNEEEGGETTEEGGEATEEEGGEATEEEGGEATEEEGGEATEEGGETTEEGGEATEEEGGEATEEGGEATEEGGETTEEGGEEETTEGGMTTGGGNQECPDSNYIVDCIGGCNPLSFIGDGACDDGPSDTHFSWGGTAHFNCEEFNFDEGDCDFGPLEEGESCPEGEIPDCDNYCSDPTSPGDGTCDDGTWGKNNFNCEKFNFDEGDCICPASSLIADCNQECRAEVYLGDGQCNAGNDITGADFNCAELNFDNGDCQCGAGNILDCNGYCHPESSLGNSTCDEGGWFGDFPNFKCVEFNFDEGDCEEPGTGGGDICAEGEVPDCDGACFPTDLAGNGTCDDGTGMNGNFNCAVFNFDEGDCGESTPGGEDICPPGTIPDCEGVCADEEYLNDGLCDDGTWGVILNCEELNYDEGDCTPPPP